jgi:hypothetical protein
MNFFCLEKKLRNMFSKFKLEKIQKVGKMGLEKKHGRWEEKN